MNYIICPGCGKKDVPDTLKKCPECNYVFNVPAGIPTEDQVALMYHPLKHSFTLSH